MSTLVMVLGVLGLAYCVVASVWSVVAAWRGSAAARRVLFAKRTRVCDLDEERPIEVCGSISFDGDGIVSPSGKRCAAAQVTMRSGVTKPENGTPHTFSRGAANVFLTDETGSMMLDLDHVEVVAPSYENKMSPLADGAAWLDRMPEKVSVYSLHVTESVVEDGAVVKVWGRVERIADSAQIAPGGAYRDGAQKIEARYRMGGGPSDRLLLTQGGTGKVLWRAGWPPFALFVFAAAFLMHAAVMVFLLLA